MHHSVLVTQHIGALALDVSFALGAPWTVLSGPSGVGKTTVLRAIAGLIRPEAGRIVRYEAEERVLTGKDTFVPPYQRAVRYAPQRASLFPHLSVAKNVAYGAGAASVDEVVEMFELAPLLTKMPAELSGGERQRVNLARAFAAADCKLMLLDEPFAGLDYGIRDRLLPRMQTWLRERGIPALSVTHDVVEALQLRAEVITIADGRVRGQGAAVDVLAGERERLLRQLGEP